MSDNEKDWLEDFIAHNRDAFDSRVPNPELWDNISPAPRSIPIWRKYLPHASVAAVLVLAFTFVWQWTESPAPQNAAQQTVAQEEVPASESPTEEEFLIPELIEAEAFYAHQVESKLNELAAVNPEMESEIRYDLNELDLAYNELKQDLHEDLANRDIVEAMIQNYRLKLEILEDILDQINKTENKTPDHGTNDYLI